MLHEQLQSVSQYLYIESCPLLNLAVTEHLQKGVGLLTDGHFVVADELKLQQIATENLQGALQQVEVNGNQ